MGEIVFAAATVHAPQLFTYPPSEDKAQLDADIAAMRELGKNLDEIKPDAVMVIGSDHLETFFLSAVPTFAIVGGEKSKAAFARKSYALPIHPLHRRNAERSGRRRIRSDVFAGRRAGPRLRRRLRMGDRRPLGSGDSGFRQYLPASAADAPAAARSWARPSAMPS